MKPRESISKWLPLLSAALLLSPVFFAHSCANTTTAPSGGDKDTIPPIIVGIDPLPGTVGVPTHGTRITFTFDEYVKVKDATAIFLSPPLSKMPKYKIRGRSVVVYFEEDLLPNTTYTLDLTNAIADNNEGNLYPGYTLTFSTGAQMDSMVVTGTVLDCNTLQPIQGATVMLYKDLSDSAVILHRPDAAVKTDAWGYFAMRNVADTLYRLYAVVDAGNNNIYDLDADKIAFMDTVFRPTIVASDTLPELLKYDMEDTLHCMARRSEHELAVFREHPSKQLIVNKKRVSDRAAYITFMAQGAEIDSLWIRNVRPDRLVLQFNPERDSLEIWVNERRRQPDTLHLYVDYLKTDSTGALVPFVEHIPLPTEKTGTARKSAMRNLSKEDTTLSLKISAEGEMVEQYGVTFEFGYPLIKEGFDSLKFVSVNPRQQEASMPYTVTRDSVNLRKYTVMPGEKLRTGYEYKLKVPHRKFMDVNGYCNDSTETKFSLPKDDKLSGLTLVLTGVVHHYIVDLLNEKRDKTIRSYNISSDATLSFPYLKEGKYSIRITEDINANGIVDTGVLLEHKQPEKVKFFRLKDGSYVIDIPESTELEQKLDVEELFSK